MQGWLALSILAILLADASVPRIQSLRPRNSGVPAFPSGEEIALFPGGSSDGQTPAPSGPKSPTLQDSSKLSLIRYVSGEFAKAIKPLPAGKEGFWLYVGKPVNGEQLDRAVASHGAAVRTGDNVQITRLEFRDHQIVVDLNGGGRGKKHWRDHLQIGMGGPPMPTVKSTSTQDPGPPGIQPGAGSTLFL